MRRKSPTQLFTIVVLLITFLLPFLSANPTNASINTGIIPYDIDYAVQNDYPALLEGIRDDPEAFGFSSEELGEISLLSPLRVVTDGYTYEDLLNGEDINILHIPLVNQDGTIIAIFSVIKLDGKISCNLGKDFAPSLEQAKISGNSEMAMYQSGYEIYPVNVEKIARKFSETEGYNGSLQAINTSDMKEQLTNAPFISISLTEVNDSLTWQARKTELHSAPVSTQSINSLSYLPPRAYLNSNPIVGQIINGQQRGVCWAATIASMARFESSKHSGLTAKMVADRMGIGYDKGATVYQARAALSTILGNPYVPTVTGVLTEDQIKTVIYNIDPAYMSCVRKTGFWPWEKLGHAVALTGYNFSTATTIRVMDPAYEVFKLASKNSSGQWVFAFGDTSFAWSNTVRLLY